MAYLSTGSEWTFELIQRYDREIARIAGDFGLDTYPNQIEIITAEQMLDAYASSGLPVGYNHWSYGKHFLASERGYQRGAGRQQLRDPRNGILQATSGFGLDVLQTDPWLPAPDEAALVTEAFMRGTPVLVADAATRAPDLASRLNVRAALLLPLVRRGDRVGLLAIGFGTPPTATTFEAGALQVADTFLAALELSRLRQSDELQQDLRELLQERG